MEQLPFPLPALAGGLTISREDRGDGGKSFWPLLFPPPSSSEMTEKPLPPSLLLLHFLLSPHLPVPKAVARSKEEEEEEDASVSAPPSLLHSSASLRREGGAIASKSKEKSEERGVCQNQPEEEEEEEAPLFSPRVTPSRNSFPSSGVGARPQASSSALSPSSPRFPREIPK